MSEQQEYDQRLLELRGRIDGIDRQLLDLISQRAQAALEVAHVKTAAMGGNVKDVVFYRPEREAQVLQKIMQLNQGPLPNEDVARLFRQIMSACLAFEQPLTVAFLGPEGSFTQEAAMKHFGDWAVTRPMIAIDEVFREVEAGAVQYGVVPVENSTEGIVNHTLDSFLSAGVKICGEVELRIHQNLMIGPNTKADGITRIYSHQQSLAQCRKWLDLYYPNVERVAVSSNSEAARRVKSEWNSAAIGSALAAERYELEILQKNIEDRPDNSTRFLIISRDQVAASGNDKTSIIVEMRNEPGALFHLLQPFHVHDIDLTRVETRPSPNGTWAYVFFIDFAGHIEQPEVQKCMQALAKLAVNVKELGSYPVAVL